LNRDEFLLSEFKKALLRNASNPVINLDEKFPHKIDLFVQVYETIIETVGDHIRPHKWSHYRIGLIKEGSADYTCGIYKFKAKENTLLIIPPRVVNSSANWSLDSKGYFLLFNLDFFLQSHFPYRHLFNKKILHPSVQPYMQLTAKQAGSVEQIFKTILQEKQGDSPHKNELIALKIIELLIVIERLYFEVNEYMDNEISIDLVKRFSELVEMNFIRERSVTFYASELHIHPNYLNALIKKYSGMTAKDSIQNRLLLEAKYLLHSTRLSIKEISNQLGFDDPNYFAVFFKRFEGRPPIAYRSSNS
jgi:AraC family transcriptional regulator, transcriptional activator of pobA